MNVKAISQEITRLPPEGQREVLDFAVFLQTRYKVMQSEKKKKGSIVNEPFIGMWKNREDMKDSVAWVRTLREQEWDG